VDGRLVFANTFLVGEKIIKNTNASLFGRDCTRNSKLMSGMKLAVGLLLLVPALAAGGKSKPAKLGTKASSNPPVTMKTVSVRFGRIPGGQSELILV
jgi:hypothetical protein